MNQNRGKILDDVLHLFNKTSGISLTKIAKEAGYDQSMMYRHFKIPDLEAHILLRYGRAIDHDFTKEIPGLMGEIGLAGEDVIEYKVKSKEDAFKERDLWRDKYIALLEKHNSMLQEKLIEKS